MPTPNIIQVGQNLSTIAQQNNMTPAQFAALNPQFAGSGTGYYNGLKNNVSIGANYNLGTPITTPPVPTTNYGTSPTQSTTTLASENKKTQVVNNSNTLNGLAYKGLNVDSTGNLKFADGSMYSPDGTYTQPSSTNTDTEDTKINSLLESMKTNLDASTKTNLDAIHKSYESLKEEQRNSNNSNLSSINNALLMGGVTGQGSSSQYAPISSQGIIAAQTNYGLKKIAQLDAEENNMLMEARKNQDSGNYKIAESQIGLIQDKRKEKIAAAQKLNENIAKQAEKLIEQKQTAFEDNLITELYASGIKNPVEIMKELNKQGNPLPVSRIANTLKAIQQNVGMDVASLNSDIDEYNYFSKIEGGLPESITGLPIRSQQLSEYIKQKKAKTETGNELTPAQVNSTVNSIAGAFDNEPVVKNHNVIQEGYQFANELANLKDPTSADDQGLVYAFAKAMDPNSAVKEGEYVTVQKYNQSLIQKGWANAKRIVKNEAFLTPEARQNMVKTIKSKYDASQKNYEQVSNEYQRQINDAYAGKPRTITQYNTTIKPVGKTSNTGGLATSW